MKMKKIICVLLSLVVLLSFLVACDNGKTEENETSGSEITKGETEKEEGTESEEEKMTESETEKEDLPKITKIACVGDSITYGIGSTNMSKTNYPSILKSLLGENYDVKEFGFSGSTMQINTHLPESNSPYIGSEKHKNAVAYEPDIVIIMLGTNDALSNRLRTEKHKESYAADAKTLIQSFKDNNTAVKIVFMTSPDIWGYDNSIRNSISQTLVPLQRQFAEDNGYPLIDIFSATEKKNEFSHDGVHLNDKGYKAIAEKVFEQLKEQNII